MITGVSPIIIQKERAFDQATGTWELYETSYTATGNERYITIGNFSPNNDCKEFHLKYRKDVQPMLAEAAYYYIDAIQLVSKDSLKATTPNEISTFRFENVNFEHNKAELLSESYNEIDSVANVLKRQPHFDITIIGHTDDSGSKTYNLNLSKARALAVKEYLISSGIAQDRIQIIGKGSSEPLSKTNAKVNRRVEFKLIEKHTLKN